MDRWIELTELNGKKTIMITKNISAIEDIGEYRKVYLRGDALSFHVKESITSIESKLG